jgi:hypothetical protein
MFMDGLHQEGFVSSKVHQQARRLADCSRAHPDEITKRFAAHPWSGTDLLCIG